jgi:hypothetical protein
MTIDPLRDPHLTVEKTRQVDEICITFEKGWRGGGRPVIEDFLPGSPGSERSALAWELLAVELEYRLLAGEHCRAEARDVVPVDLADALRTSPRVL